MRVQLREWAPEPVHNVEDKEYKKTLIYCIGHLEYLIDKGLVMGPKLLTSKGKRKFRLLTRDNYEPHPRVFEEVMEILQSMDFSINRNN
jgi:hypothetical protein